MLGTTGALLLSFVFQVFVRRYYSTEVFGVFDVYFQIFNVLSILVTLRYEQAVVLPNTRKESVAVFFVSVFFTCILSLVFFIFILLFKNQLAIVFNISKDFSDWLLLVPLSVLLFSSYNALNYWFIANKAFRVSSLNKIVRRFIEGFFQLILGITGKSFGLIFGDIIGNFANILYGGIQARKLGFFNYLPDNTSFLKETALRYKNFPTQGLIPNLLNTLCIALPVLFVSAKFNSETTGHFGLARMLISIPQVIVATSIGQVLLQRFSQYRNNNKSILKDFKLVALLLFVFSIIGSAVFYPLSKWIILFIFGEQWSEASILFKIMLLSFAFQFTVSPLSAIFIAMEKLKLQAIWQVIYFISVASIGFFNFSSGVVHFTYILTIIVGSNYVLYFLLMLLILKIYEKKVTLI